MLNSGQRATMVHAAFRPQLPTRAPPVPTSSPCRPLTRMHVFTFAHHRRIYHFVRYPPTSSTSRARTFMFLPSFNIAAPRFLFNHAMAARKRAMNSALRSIAAGIVSARRCLSNAHTCSMAFRSGECFGCMQQRIPICDRRPHIAITAARKNLNAWKMGHHVLWGSRAPLQC